MMQVWFNHQGYCVESSLGESKYLFDIPSYVENDASMLYTFRWVVFNSAMEGIRELTGTEEVDTDLVLYTDSRLLEELQGEVTPDNHFANSSLKYFLRYDALRFNRVDFRKCSENSINSRIKFNDEAKTKR